MVSAYIQVEITYCDNCDCDNDASKRMVSIIKP